MILLDEPVCGILLLIQMAHAVALRTLSQHMNQHIIATF